MSAKSYNVSKDWLKTPLQKVGDALDRVRITSLASQQGGGEECRELNETIDSSATNNTSIFSTSSEVTLRSSLGGGTEICMISDVDDMLDGCESPLVVEMKEKSRAMHLKVLRAVDLVMVKNPCCRISFEDEIVGQTPAREQTTDPVWGGPSSCFQIKGGEDSQIKLEVLEGNDKLVAHGSFPVSELLSPAGDNGNPNRWCKLHPADSQNSSNVDVGWIEVCLLPSQRPFLHTQPSTRIIAAGPELMAGRRIMDSYAVRKGVMYSVTPVTLHVYDVSNDERIANVNYYTKAFGAGGIFHAAVEVYGREYSFGGSSANVTGIFASPPKCCPMHNYRESVFLGDCELSEGQVQAILRDLKPRWMARSYNLFRKNCCFFSMEFAIELGVGTIPEWIYQMARTGEFIEPYLIEYGKRQNAKLQQQQQKKKVASREAAKKKVARESPADRMVDHAMAARLQRSFRVVQSKKRNLSIIQEKY